MAWKLQAITGELTGQEISINREMVVGRQQDADLILQSAEISRRHAVLLLADRALWVRDLGSSNGTYVNDLRIEHETLLKDGDVLQFAGLKFTVLAPVDSREAGEQRLQPEQAAGKMTQPPEAVAVSEAIADRAAAEQVSPIESVALTAAQKMNDQGIPVLAERAAETPVSAEGLPERMAVPKPAPLPADVSVNNANSVPKLTAGASETESLQQSAAKEQTKNSFTGLTAIAVLVILAIIAWLFLK
ncbi:FHA domain-containing protein [Acinetobacter sp. WZC-1]|uniref:FHA domain-containing protein n=1 Tax=Acinetobacter sp. WZC-1 TaxID=3459034 RepID=UPI00403DC957